MAQARPLLMAISDTVRFGVSATYRMARDLCEAATPGAVLIQLREPTLSLRERSALGLQLATLTQETGQALSINERLDLALLLGAGAVHLPGGALGASEARRFVSARAGSVWLSRAWHDGEPFPLGFDGVVVAPVFERRKGREPLGLDGLKRLVATHAGSGAILALGGVNAENAAAALGAGAAGVAAIGAVYTESARLVHNLGLTRQEPT